MTLKVSRYLTISDNAYRHASGKRVKLILGGRTGTLLTVPSEVADALAVQHCPANHEWVELLQRAEVLVPTEENELVTLLEESRRVSRDAASPRSITVVPTSSCNMGCDYCGQKHSGGVIDQEKETAITRRIQSAIQASRYVEVFWFGGEPLLAMKAIGRISAELIPYAQQYGTEYRAKLITNGSLLTAEKIRMLRQQCNVDFIEITLDGPPSVHDARRPMKNGSASFDQITRTILEAINCDDLRNMRYRFRTNVDRRNVDTISAYLRHMSDLGFSTSNIDFELHPVYAWSNDVSGIALGRDVFAARSRDWMRLMTQLGLNFFAAPTGKKRVVCSAVTSHDEVISASGAVFSCTEHPLVPIHERNDLLGRIEDASTRRTGAYWNFHATIQDHTVPCGSCSFLGICGGACPKHWAEGSRPCPDFKDTIQFRLDIEAGRANMQLI